MTPQEALQMLNQLASIMQMNRADHAKAIEAVKVLSDLVNSQIQAKNKEPD